MTETNKDRLVEFMLEGRRYTLKYQDTPHAYWVSCDGGPRLRYVAISTLSKVAYSDPGGLMNYAYKHGLANTDYQAATKFTQECGSAAHDQLERYITTGVALDPSGQPERVRGALTAVNQWLLDHSPQFRASEVIVCSPFHRFAGRFDFLAEVHGELVLGDLKTTDKDWQHFKTYKAAAAYAQLAGYALAFSEMRPDDPQPTRRAILHVNTNGDYDWKPDLAPDESEAAFVSKIKTYRADAAWAKTYNTKVKAAA